MFYFSNAMASVDKYFYEKTVAQSTTKCNAYGNSVLATYFGNNINARLYFCISRLTFLNRFLCGRINIKTCVAITVVIFVY